MDPSPIERLEQSWCVNAAGWTSAVRQGRIESRRLATDAAVVRAVLARRPARVLDLGCGEGWLCRALAEHGVETVGVDASPPLLEAARAAGGGVFLRLDYDELALHPERVPGGFGVIACNFALLQEQLEPLLASLRGLLRPGGALVVQTVHPWAARGAEPYRDGWRTESFIGFGDGFPAPMPWYFRTLESWSKLLQHSGYRIVLIQEPVHPDTGDPLSLLITACAPQAGG